MAKKRVGVVLAGCGFLDGAEIHEAVLTLLSLDQRDAEVICMARLVPLMFADVIKDFVVVLVAVAFSLFCCGFLFVFFLSSISFFFV